MEHLNFKDISEFELKETLDGTEEIQVSSTEKVNLKDQLENTLSTLDETSKKPVNSEAVSKALRGKVDKVEGKGLSTNDYTNEEKAQVAKNAEDIAKKANTIDYYPKMAVGVADNLRGRGEATEEYFTYRPSAGASNSISEEGVATMKRIKGNSFVWNQIYPTDWTKENYSNYEEDTSVGVSEHGIISINGHIKNNYGTFQTHYFKKQQLNYKYLFVCEIIENPNDIQVTKFGLFNRQWNIAFNNKKAARIYIETNVDAERSCGIYFNSDDIDVEGLKIRVNHYDLTKMFGAGNEPVTVEEFYARIPEGIDINAYNEGQLISMNANAIETTGFNQWDEEWELGGINTENGKVYESSTNIRSKNFNKCVGGQTYFCKGNYALYWYDVDKSFIGKSYVKNQEVSFPLNASYFMIGFYIDYGTTYHNDICINLSHTGRRNGQYEPCKGSIKDLSFIQKYFPNGMKSAGSVYDEITETEAIQRIGEVDLGNSDIKYDSTQKAFYLRLYNSKTLGKGICPKFTLNNRSVGSLSDGEMSFHNTYYDHSVIFKATSYTSVTSFKSAMSGVKLYYELVEPVVTPIMTRDINLNYPVWDWGTERAVSDVPSAPFRADIIYGFNAVDTIRTNKLNIEDILRRLAELEAKAVVEQSAEE